MAKSPATACRCGGIIRDAVCNRCGPQQSSYIDKRPSAAKRGYDRAWQQLRAHFLTMNPWCVDCDEEGIAEESTEAHHVEPIEAAPHRRLDPTNLMALCKSCHSKRTAIEENNAGASSRCMVLLFKDRARAQAHVQGKAARSDLIFDFDLICSAIGGGTTYPRPLDVAQLVVAWRRELCSRIKAGQLKRCVWLLCTDPAQAKAIAAQTSGRIVKI
jgi:5-methylcytosine-specific restriction enzyme A